MAEKRVSVIVGNGFDLSMLQKLGSERNTSYEMFYYYYFYRKNGDISNYIIERMNDNIGKTSNWSDIEYALNSKIIETTDRDSLDVLKKDLREVQRYGQNLDSTELFIVFGSSMGETDNWWWRKIISALTNDTAELIIYNYCGDNADSGEDLVERFIENAHVEDADVGLVTDRTFVVNYGPNTNIKVKFLQL